MSLVESLGWRYAAKRLNKEKISQTDLNNILEATRLSASSMGLQPYAVTVVSNEEMLKKLRAVGYNQPQIEESSHVLIFSVWDEITPERIDQFIKDVSNLRSIPLENLKDYSDAIYGKVNSLNVEQQQNWAARQVYIALGTALATAAELKIDASPMEGFLPEKFDELLGLDKQGLKSVVILGVGYRSEEDVMAGLPKVRRSKEAMFSFVD